MFLPIIFLKVKPIKHHQFKRKVFAECRSTSAFVIILLNFSSLLFITTKSWSYEQACNKSDIKTEQLTTIEELVTRADAGQEKDFGSITEKIANNLSSSNLTVSCMAVNALTGIGLGDQFVVNELLKISNDPAKPLDLRHNAIMAIKSIKIDLAKIQIISLLDDKNPIIRSDAAEVLQNAKWEQDKDKQNLIEKLTKLAKDDQYEVVRKNAISALGNLQKESKGSIIIPTSALKDHSWRVRSVAVESIGEQEKNIKVNEELVLNLLAALKNQNATLRTHAALAIEKLDFTDKDKETKEIFGQLRNALKSDINIKARSAAAKALKNDPRHDTIKDLIDIFSTTKEPKEIRKSAFNSIISTAEKLSLNDKLSSEELEKILKHFNEALKRPDVFEGDQRAILENRRDQFNTKKTQRLFYNNVIHNPWAWAVASCFTLYLGIFYMHPLWLIKIDDFLRPMSVKVSYSGIEGTISLRFLNFLRFSSMVLDAWVVSHVQSVQEEFQKIESVEARAVYIPSPMVLNGRTLPHITSQDIRDIFSKPLLIWGEGGVGKTSLSCKIAQWAMAENKSERLCQHQMLPIFIEEDFDCEPDLCKNSLIDAILGQSSIQI
jgi:HEAT repeats